jgi:hypothetical protein
MPNRYASERGIPQLPRCGRSAISLRFDGKLLTSARAKRTVAYHAVSGQPNQNASFDYSLRRQRERGNGPIPAGLYWVYPSELWTNRWFNLGSRSAWGNYRLAIHVWPGTETYDRGGFFIHGGAVPGSAGCIDLHKAMDAFVADLRDVTKDVRDCYVSLLVQYPK